MVERFTKEGEDVFWPQFVPGGCRVASDLPDSAAGATIVVYQTWKDKREREKTSATTTEGTRATQRISHAKDNLTLRNRSRKIRGVCPA